MVARLRAAPFHAWLGAIAVVGGLARLGFTEWRPWKPYGLVVDEFLYHRLGNFIATGAGYVNPAAYDQGHVVATADKPPLYPLVLALESKLGASSFMAHRLLGALLGALTILALGVLAHRLAGPLAGIVTAVLVAVDPTLVQIDAHVLSETLYGVLLALVLIAAYAVREAPTLRRGALLGVLVALAALTRPEALLIGLLLAGVLAWHHRRLALRSVLVGLLACAVVIAPWTIRNWSAFDRPVLVSQQSGQIIGGANCHATYYGIGTGFWLFPCMQPRAPLTANEAEAVAAIRATGVRYARHHAGRLPVVVAARVARTWGLWHPIASKLDLVVAWILVALALPGVFLARRRGVPVAILLVPAVAVTISSALGYGWLRYRYDADLAMLVLASFTVVAAIERVTERPALHPRSGRRPALP